MSEQINSIQEIIDVLGGPTKLALRLGCSQPVVSLWKMRGRIAPAWYVAICELLHEAGKTAPPKLFGMKKLAKKS